MIKYQKPQMDIINLTHKGVVRTSLPLYETDDPNAAGGNDGTVDWEDF